MPRAGVHGGHRASTLAARFGIGANAAMFRIVDTSRSRHPPTRILSVAAFVIGWNLERQQRRFDLLLADAPDIGRQTSPRAWLRAIKSGAPTSPAALILSVCRRTS